MALVNYGSDLNKLVVIVDLIDQNRVLAYGPTSGVKRSVINVKRLSLTNIKVDDVERGAKSEDVKAKYDAAGVDEAFAATAWGKKLAAKSKRAKLDDFGRFKVMVARIQKNKKIDAELKKLTA